MSRSTLAVFFAVVAVSPAVAAPVPAGPAAKPLTELPVPADSMVVVHLNGIDRTRERLGKLLAGVDAGIARAAAKQLDELLGELLDGRDLKAIDGTGRVFVAVGDVAQLNTPDGPFAVCLPVKDYKAFRDKFLTPAERRGSEIGRDGVDTFTAADTDRPAYLVNKDGYVIVTPNKPLAEVYAGKFDRLTVTALGRTADALLAADVSVFLNLEQVNGTYRDQIKQGRQLIGLLLQQGGMGFDPRQLRTAEEILQAVFQMVEDGRGLVIGVELRPEGVALRVDARFAPDTDTGKLVAAQKPTALAALGDLPKGMTSYSATKWKLNLNRLFPEIVADPDEPRSVAAVETLAERLAAGGTDTASVGVDLHTSLAVKTVADPDKTSAAMLKMLTGLTPAASFSNVLLKGRPVTTEAAEKHKGFTLHRAEVRLDFEATAEKIPNEAQREAAVLSMKKLMPEKVTQWFGSDGKRFVVVTAPDWATAKGLLDKTLDKSAKASADPPFAATRKQLPADAGTVTLYEAGKALAFVGEYMEGLGGAVPGVPIELPKLGTVKGDPAYLGFAVGLSGDTARVDAFAPVGALKLLRQLFAAE